MLIDIHAHAARVRPFVQRPGKTRPVAGELIAMMDAHGIDKAVVMCGSSPECLHFMTSPEDVTEICATAPDRLIPFANLDPRNLGNSPETDFSRMLGIFKEKRFKGIGEYYPNLPFDDSFNMNVFRQVEDAGFPLTFHIGPTRGGCYGCYDDAGLPRLEKVLRAFPKLKLLGHSQPFWAEIGADACDANRGGYPKGPVKPGRLVDLFRNYPNLYGDLSAGSGLNAITRDPEFGLRFMEEFQDRLLFGTDIAFLGQELAIVDYFARLRNEKLLPEDVVEKISWRNASELLGLEI